MGDAFYAITAAGSLLLAAMLALYIRVASNGPTGPGA